MPDRSWREAIIEVLRHSPEAMHYIDIAEAISEKRLRSEVGATPAASVNSTISSSIQNEASSPFTRVERGRYWLKTQNLDRAAQVQQAGSSIADAGLINAFGMYWSRDHVLWSTKPAIFGQQQPGSTPVDFADEKGVYLLHDGRAVIYVGRASDQPMGTRLRQHMSDRLNGRWDRFSWFGVYPVAETGALNISAVGAYNLAMLIVTMEALLIEGLEPPQNRKRGNDFRGVEFLQVEDPALQKSKILDLMDELKKKL